MPILPDTIVINLRGGRFILSCSTIRAYPDSLLCEKLEDLDGKTNVIDIDRDARQFGLIRQLMLYKDRTRQRDIISANRRELDEDLEYYRLKRLSRYFDSPDLANLSSGSVEHILAPSAEYYRGQYQPPSDRASLVIKVSATELVGFKFDNIFNTAKYTTYFIDEDEGETAMFFWPDGKRPALYYVSESKTKIPFNRLLLIFLTAIERYDIRLKQLVGRWFFRNLCIHDLVY